ncbi:MAG TPA: hypothetical protein VHO49_05635 [Anaerolineales bacterium]|nr:hypothetical protein [Anaerolineales bacterium]
MVSDQPIFAGVDISTGRKPFTVAVLGDGLDVLAMRTGGIDEVLSLLKEYERVTLALHVPTARAGMDIHTDLRKKLDQAGFKPFAQGDGELQWCETRTEDCFRALQPKLLPRRTIDGRIQRALILYEEGLQLSDPMDYYEEITRHKLLQGILPAETIYSIRQLDALAAAYIAWMAENRPGLVVIRGELILPKIMESDKESREQLTYL